MIGRVFFESVAGGWLPRSPLVRETDVLRPDPMGSPTPVGRRVRLGGLSGFAWSTLSLFVAAGAVYVVGRGSVWYDALDVSLMLTACLFFYAWLSAFAPGDRALVRVGVALGVGGALARFSMYLSIRGSTALGYGNAILDLSRMGCSAPLRWWASCPWASRSSRGRESCDPGSSKGPASPRAPPLRARASSGSDLDSRGPGGRARASLPSP